MTAKQALMRAVEMATRSWDQCVYDNVGQQHWVAFEILYGVNVPVLRTDNPDFPPFATCLEPYRFEDMTDD